MPAASNQFPSSNPIWGLGQNALITDMVIPGGGANDQTDANVYTITPSDSTPLTEAIGKLLLGTAGDVTVITEAAQTVTLHAMAAGILHRLPFRVTQIKATGTTATNLTGFAG